MARGATYGDMLHDARLKRGMDIHDVARRLRLRADILESIEQSDFAALPPSGYASNMIRSYARLVGLDPREMSERYLDELHVFETGRARTKARSPQAAGKRPALNRSRFTQLDGSSASRRAAASRQSERAAQRWDDRYDVRVSSRRAGAPADPLGLSRSPRRLPEGAERYGRPAAYAGGGDTDRRSYDGREVLRAYDSFAFPPADVRAQQQRAPRGRGESSNYATSPYAGLYSRRQHEQRSRGTDAPSGLIPSIMRRLPLVIGLIAIVALVVFAVSFFGGSDAPAPDEKPTMPISGLTDTSNQSSETYTANVTEPAPTSAKLGFSVRSGGRSWTQIVIDGKTVVNEAVEGPVEEDYEFSDAAAFRCGNIAPVTVTIDGAEVRPTYSEKDGEYVYEVTFASILDEWRRNHEQEPPSGSSSSASSSSSSSSSNR